jgi:hypothetical protein
MPTKEEVQNFSLMLREYSAHRGISLWDGLLHYCGKTGMESEVAASLLTKAVRADLTIEISDLNLLKRRGKKDGRLPL